MKIPFSVLALLVCMCCAQAQDVTLPQHTASPVTDSASNTNLANFDKRIEAKAIDYQQKYANAAVARYINYDVAFPKDVDEFKSLNGYAVVLVSASVHDQTELPLAHIYFTLNGKSAELPVISRTRRSVAAGTVAFTEFGPYREDVFVLVPAIALFTSASFQADFAAHRTGFDFAKGPVSAPAYLAADKSLVSAQIKPSASIQAYMALIQREYPGF